MHDFKSIISLWPTVADFAADIEVKEQHAAQMKWRNSVPPEYWTRMIRGAECREIEGVTYELFAKIVAGEVEKPAADDAAA